MGYIDKDMQCVFNVKYRCASGEKLLINISGMVLEMASCGDDDNFLALECRGDETYFYSSQDLDGKVRREWGSRTLSFDVSMGESIAIFDFWSEMPQELSFYSSLFTKSIFRREPSGVAKLEKGFFQLSVEAPELRASQTLLLVGESPLLGAWEPLGGVKMLCGETPQWCSPLLPISHELLRSPFKFVILDNDGSTTWEEGANRYFAPYGEVGIDALFIHHYAPRFELPLWRGAGVAIPVFSLRSEDSCGVGEFLDLKKMVDWAASTGLKVVQILPINDTTMTHGCEDSYPYNANSVFALHPQYISPLAAGILSDKEYLERFISESRALNALPEVDYTAVNALKGDYMLRLYEEIGCGVLASAGFKEFFKKNSSWLKPYSLFSHLRDKYSTINFKEWGGESIFSHELLQEYCDEGSAEYISVAFYYFMQYQLHSQLIEACDYARLKGVVFKGDVPIGVSPTSVDVWQEPHLFNLSMQAGAPPDAFAANGQNWGFPIYNWDVMARDGYSWWSARFRKMAEYFDAYRIDHILGFFRIWGIPTDAIYGVLGYFTPAMPYSAEELASDYDFTFKEEYLKPCINEWLLEELFGDGASRVAELFLDADDAGGYHFKPEYDTQRKVCDAVTDDTLLEGLLSLFCEVLFIEEPSRVGYYHPAISAQKSYRYRAMSQEAKDLYDKLHGDFFYSRHDDFWKAEAMAKLPPLISSTDMLTCGEDLGMIPSCVPDAMDAMQILSLEIQRMPKAYGEEFADTSLYPYRSVATISTHDMNPLRAWLLEDADSTKRYVEEVLGIDNYTVTDDCAGWVCKKVVEMHLHAPSMWTILPLQDILSIDERVRNPNPHKERINEPSNSRHYWRYRMHRTLESLLKDELFTSELKGVIEGSGR